MMMKPNGPKWRLGEILVQNGWVKWHDLEKALALQSKRADSTLSGALSETSNIPKREAALLHLGEILIRNGFISWDQLAEALEAQRSHKVMLGEILIGKGFLKHEDLSRALASQHQLPFLETEEVHVSQEALKLIPTEIARKHAFIPLAEKDNVLVIAVKDPTTLGPEIQLARLLPKGYKTQVVVIAPATLEALMLEHYGALDSPQKAA